MNVGQDATRYYLLLRYGAGHWGFPKGHLERGESDHEAALREVAEETALQPEEDDFLDGFREETLYTFHRGRTRVEKKVTFFLVEVDNRDVKISHEHTDFAWLTFEDAMQRLSFEGPRRALRNAEEYFRDRDDARGGGPDGDASEEGEEARGAT